jgi:hypothetical protein
MRDVVAPINKINELMIYMQSLSTAATANLNREANHYSAN